MIDHRIPETPGKPVLTKLAREQFHVVDYLDCRQYLLALYQEAKRKIKNYSYLRFAEDLGFGATNVIRLVIIGSRTLTLKAGRKIADSLSLHGTSRRYWTTLVEYHAENDSGERERLLRLLTGYKSQSLNSEVSQQQMEYFSEWYHPIIREALGLSKDGLTADEVKEVLDFPLRLDQVKKSLDLLVKLGFAELKNDDGRYQRTPENVVTPSEVEGLAIVRFHQKMTESAKESITRIEERRRSISAATICLPESKIELIKERIDQLMQEVMAMEEDASASKESSAVFQLNVQFFPFTKRQN